MPVKTSPSKTTTPTFAPVNGSVLLARRGVTCSGVGFGAGFGDGLGEGLGEGFGFGVGLGVGLGLGEGLGFGGVGAGGGVGPGVGGGIGVTGGVEAVEQPLCAGLVLPMPLLPSHSYP